MQNKNNQNLIIKNKKDGQNENIDNKIENPLLSSQKNLNKIKEIKSQNSQKKNINRNSQINSSKQSNKVLINNINENAISSEAIFKKNKKSCYSNLQLCEVKIKKNIDNDNNERKSLRHIIRHLNSKPSDDENKINSEKKNNNKDINNNDHMPIANSDKNMLKMKKSIKNFEILSESACSLGNDIIEEQVNDNIPNNFKQRKHSNSINYKKNLISCLKTENEKASKNNKSIFHKKKIEEENKNKLKEKNNEEIFEDIIINDCEFENSQNIQNQNLEKTKFPNLCINPFAADSESPKKKGIRFSVPINYDINNKLLMNESDEKEKEKEINNERHIQSSSTFGSNNKISISNLNESNGNSSIENLKNMSNNINGNFSKKESTNPDFSNVDSDYNYNNFLLLAKRGDKMKFLDFLKKFKSINKTMDINYQDEKGNTALHYSCEEGNLKIVEILLDANCDISLKNNNNETPLHLASKGDYFDISKKLIEKGALLSVYDSEKNTPLHYVCKYNYTEILNYFLTKSPQLNDKNKDGKIPIELTTSNEIKESIQNYLNKNETKNKKMKSNEKKNSKNVSKKNSGKSQSDKGNSQKNASYEIEIDSNSSYKIKNKTSANNLSNSIKDINNDFKSINPFENTSEIKEKTKNKNINNIISLNFNNIKINNMKKSNFYCSLSPTNSSRNAKIIKDKDKDNNINNKSKKEEISNKSLGSNENNVKEIESDEYIRNELSKNSARFFSKEKNKLNNSSLYNNIKKGTSNELKNNENMNRSSKRINNSSKGRNEVKNEMNSIDKQNTFTGKRGIVIKKKSKFSKNLTSSRDTLTDSNEIIPANLGSLNKTEDSLKKKAKKIKISIKKTKKIKDLTNNIEFETTEKIITKAKPKATQKKDEKKKKNISQKDCNLSYEQKKVKFALDSVNKNKIMDKTTDSSQNAINLNSISEERVNLSNFLCLAQLGKGSFGEVYLVQKIDTQEKYAMKVLRKERIIGQNLLKYALAERNILSITDHPFIVKLNYAFQNTTKLFLILEYCPNGDLGKHILLEKRFSEERAKFYLCEVLLALEDLHKRDIIFRDLKPDNVVLDKDGHCKLTDFGLSKEGVNESKFAQSFCGSIAYLAPEMLKRKGHGKAVDWYLLGVLFYEMLVGITPFFTGRKEDIFTNIESGELNIPDFVSPPAADLLRKLLERDPSKRLGSTNDAQEIKDYPYFKDVDWKKVYNKEIKTPKFFDYNDKAKNAFKKPRKFINDDLFESSDPNNLMGWSFINNEDL